jgi:thiol-disulfide isomerase/thioredoxin
MKKLVYLLAIVVLASCAMNNSTVTVSGKITNPLADVVTVYVPYTGETDTIATIAEDGSFIGSMDVPTAYFGTIQNGKLRLNAYLKPGATIHIECDGDEVKTGNQEGVVITGEGSTATAFLQTLSQIQIPEDMRTLLGMKAETFQSKVEENYKSITDHITNFSKENKGYEQFVEKVDLLEKIKYAEKYDYFTMYHKRLAPQDTAPIPEDFKGKSDDIPVDNYEYAKELSAYKYFVLRQLQSQIGERIKDAGHKRGTIAYTNSEFDEIVALNVPQILKDELGNQVVGSYTYSEDSIQSLMKERYAEVIMKQEYIDAFEGLVEKIEKLKPGSVAPTFAYKDAEGNEVKSEELKGKVIYIDVWATWCGPCKAEIPHLKQLEKELHNEPIAFVSVSVDTDRDAWVKMVAEKELGGYQLHAPEAWESSIIKDYAIRGIPRFIMIDKEGRLVNANATRPSNEKTKAHLLELANS